MYLCLYQLYSYLLFADDVIYDSLTLHPLKFGSDNASLSESISIKPILNDTLLEVDEEFTLTLSLLEEQNSRVTLEPQNATVVIFEIHGEGKLSLRLSWYGVCL